MRIIPVLDLKAGQVVRIGGRRHEYRPITSGLTASSSPAEVARAFRDQLELREVYIADLDAIGGNEPALSIFAVIQSLGAKICVDAGVHDRTDARKLATAGVDTIVVGLETINGPAALASICEELGGAGVLFSLDLRDGKPIGDVQNWNAIDGKSIALQAISLGVRRLLVLDLAHVGKGAGIGTESLCGELLRERPHLELLVGGGIRDRDDLRRLNGIGVAGVLIASALHDGRLKPADWADL